MNKTEIKNRLFAVRALQHGDFTLKSGRKSCLYFDMRSCFSSPNLFRSIVQAYHTLVAPLSFDLICGVPYAALPFAAALAYEYRYPQILVRKEPKSYGTKKKIEGTYVPGQTCLIIEDVVTTGGSIVKLAQELEAEGLVVKDLVAFTLRDPSAKTYLEDHGYRFHSYFHLEELTACTP